MSISRFFVALLAVVIYEMLMLLIQPVGLSTIKLVITMCVWISCYLAVSTFIVYYQSIRNNMPFFAFIVFVSLILWNIINIVRGAFSGDTITTILGNNGTSLALLVPFASAFGFDETNLKRINSFFIGMIIIGAPAYIIFFAFSGQTENIIYNQAFQILIFGAVFLITLIPLQTKSNKLIIFLASPLLFYLAIKTEVRVMLLRILMLYFSLIAIHLYEKFNLKWIITVSFLTLLIPFLLLQISIYSGQSEFERYLSKLDDQELSVDTRTFLYTELFDDLSQNNKLLIGKGCNARYYSPYFAVEEGDSSLRLSMEVGILALLLKGGLIAVFLNLSLLLIAIYLAFFRTNNYLVMSVGFMLLVHTLLLFIQNYIEYSTYNLAIWFFIGVCLSKKLRSFSNVEIKNILLYGNNIS